MHEPRHLKSVLRDNPEEYSGVGNGRGGSELGGHMYTCGHFMLMYGKNHHSIANVIISN